MAFSDKDCALCGTTAAAHATGETHEEGGQEYTLFSCTHCKAQFWTPFNNPGAAWYGRDERYADRNRSPILAANKKQIDALSFVPGTPGRLLDVGCGVGNFLAHAQTKGWEGWGIDFDADAIESGKRTFGLKKLAVADLATFKTLHPELRFNLITFFDVFEHLDNHAEFMAQVHDLLEPGGMIAFSVPYRHGSRFLLPKDLPPRHLTRWDEESLSSYFTQAGFTSVILKQLPARFEFFVLKLRFRYGTWLSFGMVARARANEMQKTPASATLPPPSSRTPRVALLAKIKDYLVFGVPALMLWLILLPTRKRYTDLYGVATKV